MTFLQIISKWFNFSAPKLIRLLDSAPPDLQDFAQELKSKLAQAGSPGNLAGLAAAVLNEVPDIARGKFKPSDRPSDLV